jgi:hypothetical protein
MTNPLEQLNLRPQEKRVLVVVSLLIFIALNFWLVTPIFGQFAKMQSELDRTRKTLAKYETEIAKAPNYERLESALKKEGGDVLTEELQLQRVVDNQARASGVMVSRFAPGVRSSSGRTNQFFEDQGLSIDFTTGGSNIVEFLVGLATGNSMIRVQEMNLRPDGTGTKLAGNIQFVASYQKKNPVTKTASTVAGAPKTSGAPPVKTTGSTSTKPATNTVAAKPKPGPAPKPGPKTTNQSKTSATPPKGATNTNSAKPKK